MKKNITKYFHQGWGLIGSNCAMPNISSILDASRNRSASPRGRPTICNPTGSPFSVNPQGRLSTGHEVIVRANVIENQSMYVLHGWPSISVTYLCSTGKGEIEAAGQIK